MEHFFAAVNLSLSPTSDIIIDHLAGGFPYD